MTQIQQHNVPALRFPEFNTLACGEWEVSRLGTRVTKVGSGVTPKGGADVYQEYGIPLLRSQNVRDSRLDMSDVAFISEEINAKMKGSAVKPNDVLLNITGASIGRSCVVPSDIGTANVNQHVCIIRLDLNSSSSFLQSFLASHRGQKLIFQSQSGSGREGLNFENIKTFKTAFPTLPEQQKIANFLSSVDRKIEQLCKKKTLLEQYKKGMMQRLFSQTLRFKQEARSAKGTTGNENDHGNDFPDWQEKRLGEVCQLQGGYAFKSAKFKKDGVPIIRISNISNHNNYIQKNGIVFYEKLEKTERFEIKYGDLLIAMSGATTGKSSIYNLPYPAYLNQRVGLFRVQKTLIQGFLVQFVFSNFFYKQLDAVLVAGAQPNISSKDIEGFRLNLPTSLEQQKIADFLSSIDQKIDLVATELNHVKSFKKGLLQRMFI